jgi:hypothetical protein
MDIMSYFENTLTKLFLYIFIKIVTGKGINISIESAETGNETESQ